MQEFEFDDKQGAANSSDSGISFEIERVVLALKKTWHWPVLLLIVGFLGAYYYLKYTKPVFQANSVIKLDYQSDASELGGVLGSAVVKNTVNLSGEIELIKSPIVALDVANSLPLDITYIAQGKVLNTELYKISPFEIVPLSDPISFPYDKQFSIVFEENASFQICSEEDKKSCVNGKVGTKLKMNEFEFIVLWNKQGAALGNQRDYYFTLNSKSSIVSFLLSGLEVLELNKEARTINISFIEFSKEKAVDIVNAFDTIYLRHSLSKKQKSQDQTIAFIEMQLKQTEQKLDDSEKDIESFVRSTGTISPSGEFTFVTSQIKELETQRASLQYVLGEMNKLQSFILSDKSADNIIPISFKIENAQVQDLVNQLNTLFKEREMLKISNKETTLPFKKIELEISIIKSQVLQYIRENKVFVSEQSNELLNQINKFKSEFSQLPSKETELNRLKRFNSLYEKFYLSLLDQQVQYQISKAGAVPEFTILSPASASSIPIHPVENKIWLMFLVGGLVLGLSFVVLKYLTLNVILSPQEAEKKLLAPIIGLIPRYSKKLEASTLLVDNRPKSAMAESLRSVRTNADFIMQSKKCNLIGVTSTISGEGKTMIAINYAAVLAMGGKKVILLDLDMRKPKIHIGFEVDNLLGMSTVLIGQTEIQDAIKNSRVAGFDFITSGPTPPNPSELLLRDNFRKLISTLSEMYDFIIFDNPPIGLVTDASSVLKLCDLSIYVIRSGYSQKHVTDNINNLYKSKKFPNLTVIINDVNAAGGYGYKYSYGYGYGYYDDDSRIEKNWFKKLFSRK